MDGVWWYAMARLVLLQDTIVSVLEFAFLCNHIHSGSIVTSVQFNLPPVASNTASI